MGVTIEFSGATMDQGANGEQGGQEAKSEQGEVDVIAKLPVLPLSPFHPTPHLLVPKHMGIQLYYFNPPVSNPNCAVARSSTSQQPHDQLHTPSV